MSAQNGNTQKQAVAAQAMGQALAAQSGMTKRETMAMMFLCSMLQNDQYEGSYDELADEAVAIADTMLAKLRGAK